MLMLVGLVSGRTAMAQSQASTGQIVGTVVDQQGAAIVGAEVTVTNTETGLKRVVQTNSAGQYRVVLLPAGRYDVSAEASGFQRMVQSGVIVTVGSSVDVNFALRVGEITETVEVTAAIGVETTRPEAGALVNTTAIRDLPINGRRFQDFVTLTPTVQVEPQRNQLSIAGQRGINANISIDGADYNEPFFGGIRGGERSNNAFTIPQEAIAEFQVVTTGYSAEFGRSTGGIVNAITKSGTNEFHGSAFYLLRHKELTAEDAFGQVSLGTQQQFGGSLGGPVIRDKMFFFGAIERQDFTTPRQVFFSRLVGITPTPETQEAFDFYKSLEEPFDQTNDATSFLIRTDNQFGLRHRLAIRYNFSDNNAENANATGDAITPLTRRALSTNGTEKDRTHTVVGQFTSTLSPTVINELRLQYSREERPRPANSFTPHVGTTIGEFGTRSFLPTTLTDWRFQAAEALTWNPGRHSFKFGFEWNHVFVDQLFGFNQTGNFFVSGSDVNEVLELLSVGGPTPHRFDSRRVSYFRQIGNLTLTADMDEVAFYGQDSWRLSNTFTLTYGLRWEGAFNPEPEANNTDLINRVRGFPFPLGRVDPTFIPDNTDQVMPRVGFAWDPTGNGRTVIRAHGGIYYAHTPLLLFAAPLNNFRLPPGDLSIRLPLSVPAGDSRDTVYEQLLAIGIDLDQFSLGNLPLISAEEVQRVAEALGVSVDPFAGARVITWADNFENPRSVQWGFGVEHELVRGLTAGVRFDYINTVHLERNRDYNLPEPIIRSDDLSQRPFFGLRSGGRRPVSTLDRVTLRESSARSLYRAFTFRVNYLHTRVQFNAYYTLSWNYSDDDNERSAGGLSYENGFDLQPEYSFSRLDARHLFVFSTVVPLPLGFEISALGRVRSARPLDPIVGFDANEDRGGTDRPFRAPGVPFRRNSFRDRATTDVDLRILKGFTLWNENAKLQLSLEFFNLFDLDNVTFGRTAQIYGLGVDPATGNTLPPADTFRRLRLADGSFDKSNIPGSPFQAQVGLRLIF